MTECELGGTASKWNREAKSFDDVPCEGQGGKLLCWTHKIRHMKGEFDAGRDPVGKGGTPFRVSASEGWTQMEHLRENSEVARREGKDLQLTSTA